MTAAPKPDARRKLLAAVHAEAKRHGMDDDMRRDLVLKVTGKASTAFLSPRELGKVLDAIKGRLPVSREAVRGRALADSPHARKMRALWLSLWNLGVVDSPSEDALGAFAERQCGVQALQWVRPAEASRIIEALRGMAARRGFAPKANASTADAEAALAAAQRMLLVRAQVDISAIADLPDVRARIRAYGELIRANREACAL